MGAVDEQTVEALARAVDLDIPAQYLAGVAENLQRLLTQARLVMEFELPPEAEPAPVFRP